MTGYSHVAMTRQALALNLNLDLRASARALQDHEDSRGSGNAPRFDDTDEHNDEKDVDFSDDDEPLNEQTCADDTVRNTMLPEKTAAIP